MSRIAAPMILALAVVAAAPPARAQTPTAPAKPAPAPAAAPVEEIEEADVQEINPVWNAANFPAIDRILNVQTGRTMRRLALDFVVDHRCFAAIQNNPFKDFLGLDSGSLKIGLGLRFGIIDHLDVGIYRLSNGPDGFDVYELDFKGQPLWQDRFFLDVAVRAGVTWFSQSGAQDRVGGFAQLLVTRSFFHDRLILSSGLLFHSDSSNDAKSTADTRWSLAVPAAIEGRILPWLALAFEVVGPVAGYRGEYPDMTAAVKFITNRHTFAILVSNTQYVSADGIVAGSSRGFRCYQGGTLPCGLVFGFQITREFDF